MGNKSNNSSPPIPTQLLEQNLIFKITKSQICETGNYVNLNCDITLQSSGESNIYIEQNETSGEHPNDINAKLNFKGTYEIIRNDSQNEKTIILYLKKLKSYKGRSEGDLRYS